MQKSMTVAKNELDQIINLFKTMKQNYVQKFPDYSQNFDQLQHVNFTNEFVAKLAESKRIESPFFQLIFEFPNPHQTTGNIVIKPVDSQEP